MAGNVIRIGTRGSQLALRQAEAVKALLGAAHPDLTVELVIIQTTGDRILDRALSRIGDKGLFVTEIETALIAGRIDLAVHSCKDLPAAIAPECELVAFPERADARDVVVSRHACTLSE